MSARAHIAAILFLSAFASTTLLGVDVNIPDAGLEAALRFALNKPTGSPTLTWPP